MSTRDKELDFFLEFNADKKSSMARYSLFKFDILIKISFHKNKKYFKDITIKKNKLSDVKDLSDIDRICNKNDLYKTKSLISLIKELIKKSKEYNKKTI